jgi:hypothetical protein
MTDDRILAFKVLVELTSFQASLTVTGSHIATFSFLFLPTTLYTEFGGKPFPNEAGLIGWLPELESIRLGLPLRST